tara:strand:+ start:1892 stop:3397 length:1506 start_codon:yes stop_codon:yes gene_type:complete
MENLIVKITQLHEKHKKSPKTLDKLTYYVEKQLPALLDKYDAQEKRRIFLEKESKRYINSFLSQPDHQYFYINNTDTFIEYNGCDYKIIPEDNLWFKILNDITEKKTLLEWKQKIKSKIIDFIKIKKLLSSIPESQTIQNMINFFTPILFTNKEKVKYFFAIIGDNILGKSNQNNYFVQEKSKEFFEILENLSGYYFDNKLNISNNFKFKYRGQSYNNSRLIYFTNNIKNKSVWFSFIKENFLNFIVLCSHYSSRYINAENYSLQRNDSFKNEVFYLKKNTKEQIIDNFINKFTHSDEKNKIHTTDMQFLWNMFLKEKNIENIIYKVELENILRNKLTYSSGNYLNLHTIHANEIKIFKSFFDKHIIYEDDDELEISEIHKILQTNNECNITENLLEDLISHYTSYRSEDGKTINNISCNLWDKHQEILEAFENKFNKPDVILNNTNNYISIYDTYILYCKYSNNNNKILTVSKKYFEKQIIKLIPNEFIWNNNILLTYWN